AAENPRVFRAEHLNDFLPAPDIISSFGVFRATMSNQTVSIFRREKAALGMRHVPQQILEHLAGDFGEKFVASELPRLEKRNRQLRLVIEHLLKMRHMPKLIDRIPVKSSTEMIAHAASSHSAQRKQRHVRSPVRLISRCPCRTSKEKIEDRLPREFGRAAKATVIFIEASGEILESPHERAVVLVKLGAGHAFACLRKRGNDSSRLCFDLVTILLPKPGDLGENAGESSASIAVVG